MHAETMSSSRPGRMGEQGVRITRRTGVRRQPMPSHRLPARLERGQGYVTETGRFGYYVGTKPGGERVFCFGRLPDLERMCRAFDDQFGPVVRKRLPEPECLDNERCV